MDRCVITGDALGDLLRRLINRQRVMGPTERKTQPGFHYFDWIDDPDDIALDYLRTTIPPKKAFFPPEETILEFEDGDPPQARAVIDEDPVALVGVHPCDLAAISMLDDAYAEDPADRRWAAHRADATIIGIDCHPDEYCFCTSVGSWRARGPADLFLTPVERGYLVEILSDTGRSLIEESGVSVPTESDLEDAETWLQQKQEKMTAGLDASVHELAQMLQNNDFDDLWHEVADRCYSCGSCNTTCPTCFCFDVHDEFNLDMESGRRVRTWDSCQLEPFALVAGGYNFRRDRWERVRHRWYRKFAYLYDDFGVPYCTGCGRCSRACTADINIVDVTNEVIAEGRSRDQ